MGWNGMGWFIDYSNTTYDFNFLYIFLLSLPSYMWYYQLLVFIPTTLYLTSPHPSLSHSTLPNPFQSQTIPRGDVKETWRGLWACNDSKAASQGQPDWEYGSSRECRWVWRNHWWEVMGLRTVCLVLTTIWYNHRHLPACCILSTLLHCISYAVDDMVDTAGTLCKAAEVLKGFGARRVFAFASHGSLPPHLIELFPVLYPYHIAT